jgi:hypothetical protein
MRKFIEIVEGAATDPVDQALALVAQYVTGNLAPHDWHEVAAVLRQSGYQEPMRGSSYFRAIFHQPTDLDRQKHTTIGQFFEELKAEVRFDLNRVQGFTTSLDNAIDFIHGQYHIQWYRAEWPHQTPDTLLGDHGRHNVAVVYEVEVDPANIIWSNRGLLDLLGRLPRTGQGWDKLKEALTNMWSGYASDDEVVIDTTTGARVLDMTLYDSDEHLI